ncbi:MAG: hypothetical protein HKN47_21640 [Pirellulaceae bacterium]|nr:hypothetical protein [Pirellulaceae bacterium]
MGLLHATTRFLLSARRAGCSFDEIATLGRQQIYLRERERESLKNEFADQNLAWAGNAPAWGAFAEDFLQQCLGSKSVASIDFSDFEQATIQHDLNQPIPLELHERFDAVIDGGTLEHIFNVPVALANCMQMVRTGGCVVLTTNANNHCGHGFYQFSPELFFRVFQPDNGYQVQKVVLVEHPYPGAELSSRQQCYEVVDPDEVRCRVGLVSRHPVMMMVLAKRIAVTEIFAHSPQQSDYQSRWQEHTDGSDQSDRPLVPKTATAKLRRIVGNAKRLLFTASSQSIQQTITGREQLNEYSLQNEKFYRRWRP